ncbi:DUF2490 domain-containing protein [Pedobacter sp. SD-b]|uniref:DUF2490 domain-containing protein n=1 Tax=Pedobacter segetis TaxID=2793069 RepID=A0ABS1BF76_9SPHI|nr:DUF2490 domain-containing protein [Pedobacter segetis]MBK0381475.1 DUF2490 domain-containing protein [Pedobacter segetis]
MKYLKYSLLLIILSSSTTLLAQNSNLGSWNSLNIKYKLSNNWGLFGEAQFRSQNIYNNFFYYQYLAGFSYKFTKNAFFSLAAGSYQTFEPDGNFTLPKKNSEFRLSPMITTEQNLGRFEIESRYRAEFRFINTGYKNRFRYRLGLAYPFGKEIKDYKPFKISANDEIFLTDKGPYFERNRLLLAFNYKTSEHITLQTGYLRQFDYKTDHQEGKDFLDLGILFSFAKK